LAGRWIGREWRRRRRRRRRRGEMARREMCDGRRRRE
jgi:hypothetical protein